MTLYQVENQWGSSSEPWHEGGTWEIGCRLNQNVVAIDVKSVDGGQTLSGIMTYAGEGSIGFRATRSSDNNYTVENQWGGDTAPWHSGGKWILGGRTNQNVIELNLKSDDGGKTLNGTMTYAGEGPIRFKATMTEKDPSDASHQVRFSEPISSFSPDGMVSRITGNQTVNDTTTQYMSQQSYRQGKFMQTFSQLDFEGLQEVQQPDGDTVWAAVQAIDNQEFNFYLSKAEILQSITLTEVTSQSQINETANKYNIKPEATYITIDGKKYFVHMNLPMHFGTGENNNTWINFGVFIIGDTAIAATIAAIIAALGGDAFTQAIKNIGSALFKTLWYAISGAMKAAFRFIVTFVRTLLTRATLEAAVDAAKIAAGEAWTGAVRNLSSKTLRYSVIGVIVLVTITLIIDLVLHESYQSVYLYNLTDYDIEFDFPYKDYGNPHNVPNLVVSARHKRKGPDGKDLGSWYNGLAFRFQSDSEFHGLGYTMRFKLRDPGTQNVVKTFACLFDVPFAANNSLFASANDPGDYKQYYKSNSGTKKVTQYSANDGHQEIIVTYDYLSGKHEDPETGQSLYLYNSLVVIRDLPT